MIPILWILTWIVRGREHEDRSFRISWNVLGGLLSSGIITGCVYYSYVISNEMSSDDNTTWMWIYGLNIVIEMTVT